MNLKTLSQFLKALHGIAPVANAFAGTVTATAIKLGKQAKRATAIYYKGVGTTGTATVTVEACSASDGTGATAIPFRYSLNTTSDTFGNVTECAAAGFTTTAGSNHIYLIDIDPRDVPDGFPWIRIKSVEVVASAVLGGIMWLPWDFRYEGESLGSVLS